MTTTLEALLAQALALPERERAALAARLLRSLEREDDATPSVDEWEASWSDEIDRRLAEVRSGNVELVDGDTVLHEARARLASRRP